MKLHYSKEVTGIIRYQIVICTRRKRQVFTNKVVCDRFKECLISQCKEMNIDILKCTIHSDHIFMFLDCPSHYSPKSIIDKIKAATTPVIEVCSDWKNDQNLWAGRYYVTTEPILDKVLVKEFLESQSQKKR